MTKSPVFLLFSLTAALYEEPPGGCQAPPDDGVIGIPPPRRLTPKPKSKPPVPEPEPTVLEEEVIAKLERETYERESMEQLEGLGREADVDWDEVERQHLQELAFRSLLQQVVAFVTACYVLRQLYHRFKRPSSAPGAKHAAAADADTNAATPSADGAGHDPVEGDLASAASSTGTKELGSAGGGDDGD